MKVHGGLLAGCLWKYVYPYLSCIMYIHAHLQVKIFPSKPKSNQSHFTLPWHVYINIAFETFIRTPVTAMMLLPSAQILATHHLSSKYAEFIFVEHSREEMQPMLINTEKN